MQRRWVIGLSSGSSLHGTQAALVEAQGVGMDVRVSLLHAVERPFPTDLRALLWRVQSGAASRQAALAHRVLGEWFAATILRLAEEARVDLQRVLCAGIGEVTLGHDSESRYPGLLSLGMTEIVAEKTGLTVVSRFRPRDLAAGGLGAPITAFADHLLLGDSDEDRLLLHLGGWATLLYLPARDRLKRMIGFPAAPCGLLLDGLMRLVTGGKEACDAYGKHAVQGRSIDPLLSRWLSHPLLQRRPPRLLRVDDFGEAFLNQGIALARSLERGMHDVLCTAAHFIAQAVGEAIERFVPAGAKRVTLSGGGVRNGLLLRLLEQRLRPLGVEKLEARGLPAEARQALAYGVLSLLTLDGVPANVAAVTGAAGPRLLGDLTPGVTRNWARCLAWMSQQMAPFQAAAA